VIGLIAIPAGPVFVLRPSASRRECGALRGGASRRGRNANTWALRIPGLIATVGSTCWRAGRPAGLERFGSALKALQAAGFKLGFKRPSRGSGCDQPENLDTGLRNFAAAARRLAIPCTCAPTQSA